MDDHRPLSGADLETWSSLATVLEWLPPALDAALVRDFDLTHFEYGVLYALAAAPDGALRMSTLADFANSSLSRLSRAVSRLETRGWARRSPDPADGRSTLAVLTDDGRVLLDRATPTHERAVRRLVLDPLTSTQRRQLKEIAQRMQRAIGTREGWRP